MVLPFLSAINCPSWLTEMYTYSASDARTVAGSRPSTITMASSILISFLVIRISFVLSYCDFFSLGCFNPADSNALGQGPRYALIWAQAALSKSFLVGRRPSSAHFWRRRSSAQAFFSYGVTCIPPSFPCNLPTNQKECDPSIRKYG